MVVRVKSLYVFLIRRREGLDPVGKEAGLWKQSLGSCQRLKELAYRPGEHQLNDEVMGTS